MSTRNLFHGVVRGRIIELDSDPQLPDGEKVTLEIRSPTLDQRRKESQLESLRRACGGWKDMPGIDEFLEETYAARRSDRPGQLPESTS
jgi:hypothetical protein